MIQRTKRIVALLVILIAVAGCGSAPSGTEDATPTPIPTPIVPIKPTYEVQRGEVVESIEFTGRIAPVVEEELFFRTAGYVEAVYVKRDDEVQAGDILAELETTDLQNQLAQARADLEAIELNAAQQIAEAKANLTTAELQLARTKADNPEAAVTVARVDLERAQLALEDAQEARQDVLDQPWLRDPVKALEAVDRQVHQAELSLEVAEAQYEQALQARLMHNYTVQIQEQEVALARLRLEEIEAGLDLKRAQLTVDRLEDQLADARVIAPFDGLLLSLSLTEGRMVDGYKTVAVIAKPNDLEVSAEPTDKNLQELYEGMPVTVAPVSRPGDEIKGYIRRLPYPYGGGGRTVGAEEEDTSTRVTLEVTVDEAGLERGDLVRVTVVLERKDDVLWLPPQAVRTFEGREFVVVQDGEAQLRVDVKVGIESEDRVEIEEGLTEGQIVIGQ
jgi:RND family efflux transporter MFP subunit